MKKYYLKTEPPKIKEGKPLETLPNINNNIVRECWERLGKLNIEKAKLKFIR